MTTTNIAVIPARGGSKRIKKKNIREFAGKPLLSYSIEAAKNSGSFKDIVVSTDDHEIAEIASSYGASIIIERPSNLSDDQTGTSPVVRHAVDHYVEKYSDVDFVCCIYATAPFLAGQSLSEGLSKLVANEEKCYAFSVTTFDFPIQRALRMSNGGVLPADSDCIVRRSQDLEEMYHDAGQFYWGRKEAWLTKKPMFKEHSLPIILPRYLVQDIDTEEDWVRAELMYKSYVLDMGN